MTNKNTHNLPFMYLVAEYMQMSAPKARGRCVRGEKKCWGRERQLGRLEECEERRGRFSPGNTPTWRCCPQPPQSFCRARGKFPSRPWCRRPSWWDWWESRSTPAAQGDTSVMLWETAESGGKQQSLKLTVGLHTDQGQMEPWLHAFPFFLGLVLFEGFFFWGKLTNSSQLNRRVNSLLSLQEGKKKKCIRVAEDWGEKHLWSNERCSEAPLHI